MSDVYMALSMCAILFSGVTAVFSVLAYCRVVGMERSTHQIQYMPAPQPQLPESELDGPTGELLAKGFYPEDEEL